MGQVSRAAQDVVEDLGDLVVAYKAAKWVPLFELERILDNYDQATT